VNRKVETRIEDLRQYYRDQSRDRAAGGQPGWRLRGTAAKLLPSALSIDDVRSIQGEPQRIVDLGSKKIYLYKDLKITFTD
jgi:hypothetical protein